MAKDRSLVRASDIGQWAYCQRAWWLANVKGAEHGNPDVLRRGTEQHDAHGRQVLLSHRMRQAGLLLLLCALVLILIILLSQLLAG